MKAAIAILALTTSVLAQDTPKKPHNFFDKQNVTLFTADALVRSLDAQSTRAFMTDPCKCFVEAVLPNSIVDSSPKMYSYSLGFAAGMMGLSYVAHRMGHHKIERLIPMLDIGFDGEAVVKNYNLKYPVVPVKGRLPNITAK